MPLRHSNDKLKMRAGSQLVQWFTDFCEMLVIKEFVKLGIVFAIELITYITIIQRSSSFNFKCREQKTEKF